MGCNSVEAHSKKDIVDSGKTRDMKKIAFAPKKLKS
jgi:hypothetical protein